VKNLTVRVKIVQPTVQTYDFFISRDGRNKFRETKISYIYINNTVINSCTLLHLGFFAYYLDGTIFIFEISRDR